MYRRPTAPLMRQAINTAARSTAAEEALFAALVAAAGAGCTKIVMGAIPVEYLYRYFRTHKLILPDGLKNSLPTAERQRNLFRVLVRLARSILYGYGSLPRGDNK